MEVKVLQGKLGLESCRLGKLPKGVLAVLACPCRSLLVSNDTFCHFLLKLRLETTLHLSAVLKQTLYVSMA
jgi:hypothetical protein